MSVPKNEPVLTAITGLIAAVIAVLVAFGVAFTAAQTGAIIGLSVAAYAAFGVVRSRVTPT